MLKNKTLFLSILSLFLFAFLEGAEKGDLAFIKNDLRNHECEIEGLKEQLANQDIAFQSLQSDLKKDVSSLKSLLKDNLNLFEGELKKVTQKKGNEDTSSKALQDTFKEEFKNTFSDYKKKLIELEETLKSQDKKIQDLQKNLKKLLSCLENDTDLKPEIKIEDSTLTYKVKGGDSLEKIAKKEKVSLTALKELNHLKNDTILVGQTLKLPTTP